MSYLAPSISSLQSTETVRPCAIRSESQPQGPQPACIHILDDDSLINIFHLYRPPIFDSDENDQVHTFGGREWHRERWWHKLTQVCQRWRNLIFGSSNYLGLCLVCAHGTPVADMLAHSPPLPLVIDYFNIPSNYDEGVILALEQRHRVRRVRLCMMYISGLQKLVMAMDKEYPVLECLVLVTMAGWGDPALVLPETLEAPNLRHLFLRGVVPPIESRLLTTAVGMVTLCLLMQQPSSYFQPDILVQCLSSMPQLETLLVTIHYPIPDHVTRQLSESDTPITTRATLPNLRWFQFEGSGPYMEALVHRIIAPCLEKLNIQLNNEFALPVPHLLQFMNTTNSLRFDSATFEYSQSRGCVMLYLREEPEVYALSLTVLDFGWPRDMQILSSVGQIFNSLSQRLSTVEHLSLASPEGNDEPEVDPAEWGKFLRSFRCVKTLGVDDRLVEQVSRCLESDDGEYPPELLPVLQELTYSGNNHTGRAFTSFVTTGFTIMRNRFVISSQSGFEFLSSI